LATVVGATGSGDGRPAAGSPVRQRLQRLDDLLDQGRRGVLDPGRRIRMSPYRDSDRELWPGLTDGIPAVLCPQLEEPAFSDGIGQFLATAVLWRLPGDDHWHAGEGITFPPPGGPYGNTGPDGSGMLEILLDDIVDRYVEFASDYYEIEVDRAAVEHVIAQQPLTDTVIRALNPQLSVADLRDDVTTIGYPIAAT
jgi:hypothetical protein